MDHLLWKLHVATTVGVLRYTIPSYHLSNTSPRLRRETFSWNKVEVIVKSQCEYNIAVISQDRGAAEDVGKIAILYEHIRDLTGFYPMH